MDQHWNLVELSEKFRSYSSNLICFTNNPGLTQIGLRAQLFWQYIESKVYYYVPLIECYNLIYTYLNFPLLYVCIAFCLHTCIEPCPLINCYCSSQNLEVRPFYVMLYVGVCGLVVQCGEATQPHLLTAWLK